MNDLRYIIMIVADFSIVTDKDPFRLLEPRKGDVNYRALLYIRMNECLEKRDMKKLKERTIKQYFNNPKSMSEGAIEKYGQTMAILLYFTLQEWYADTNKKCKQAMTYINKYSTKDEEGTKEGATK